MFYTMPMKPFRQLLATLLLLAYVGQSLAIVAMPCSVSIPGSADTSTAMAGMDHAGHYMDAPPQAAADRQGCCEGGGFCSMSHCQSVAALPETSASPGITYVASYRAADSLSSPVHPAASPFRPPISR
jgi:hypothetical protein